MSVIQYICMSDVHFGADNSVLTNLTTGLTLGVDPSEPSTSLIKLVDCLRALVKEQIPNVRPRLILNGDIFEFALAEDNLAGMAFQRFLELAMPNKPEERLFDDEILYIPGNHDHHLWEGAREIQYADFIRRHPTSHLPAPWHATKMDRIGPVASPYVNAVIDACGVVGVRVNVRYPNLILRDEAARRSIVFSHGHFTEPLYTLMTTLSHLLFPPTKPDVTEPAWAWESENFAWIDFFWGTMGRSGFVGQDIGLIYEMMQDPRVFGAFIGKAAERLAQQRTIWPLAKLLGWLVRRSTTQRMERGAPDQMLGDGGAGVRKYLSEGVYKQLEQELKDALSDDIVFVFGHTHKPFQMEMEVDFPNPRKMRLYNSGGWVVDRTKPGPLYGGAVVLISENLDVVSLRMYNEHEQKEQYGVSVQAVGRDCGTPFFQQLESKINSQCKLPPWRDFSDSVAAAVIEHNAKLRNDINESRLRRRARGLKL
ncbi:MAG: hypothetical protein ACREQR_06370 [Candidatus Binataceae bacterium]